MKTLSLTLAGLILMVTAPYATAQKLNACGATFPDPIYKTWFGEFGDVAYAATCAAHATAMTRSTADKRG